MKLQKSKKICWWIAFQELNPVFPTFLSSASKQSGFLQSTKVQWRISAMTSPTSRTWTRPLEPWMISNPSSSRLTIWVFQFEYLKNQKCIVICNYTYKCTIVLSPKGAKHFCLMFIFQIFCFEKGIIKVVKHSSWDPLY